MFEFPSFRSVHFTVILLSNSIRLVNLRMNDILPVLIAVKSSFRSLVLLVSTGSTAPKVISSLISPDKPHLIVELVVLQKEH